MKFLSGKELQDFMQTNHITAIEVERCSRQTDKKGVCRQTVQKAYQDEVPSMTTLSKIHEALALIHRSRRLASDRLHDRLVDLRWIPDPAEEKGMPVAPSVATAV